MAWKLREANEAHAERVVQAELKPRGWKDAEWGQRRKRDPVKAAIAWRLRQETTMILKWIAGG